MIQVTLNDSHFNHSGTYNKRPFDSLQIRHISNGRVYFTAITNGIRMFEVIKQMQLVDGKVIISFGKNDKLEIGTYIDTEAVQEVEEVNTNTTLEANQTTANEPAKQQEAPTNNTPDMKLSKEKETILVRGYMGKVEQVEGKQFKYKDFECYLVQSSKSWSIYEKETGSRVTDLKKTKKEVIQHFKELMSNYYDKLSQIKQQKLEKDGNINNYAVGQWVR